MPAASGIGDRPATKWPTRYRHHRAPARYRPARGGEHARRMHAGGRRDACHHGDARTAARIRARRVGELAATVDRGVGEARARCGAACALGPGGLRAPDRSPRGGGPNSDSTRRSSTSHSSIQPVARGDEMQIGTVHACSGSRWTGVPGSGGAPRTAPRSLEAFEIFSSTLAGRLGVETGRALGDARGERPAEAARDTLDARLLGRLLSGDPLRDRSARGGDPPARRRRAPRPANSPTVPACRRTGTATEHATEPTSPRGGPISRTSHLAQRVLFEQLAACTAIHDGELAAARTHNDSLVDESRWAVYEHPEGQPPLELDDDRVARG